MENIYDCSLQTMPVIYCRKLSNIAHLVLLIELVLLLDSRIQNIKAY